MLNYTRAYVKTIVGEQKSLVIELAGCKNNCDKCTNIARLEEGQPLTKERLEYIKSTFKKYVASICFVGGESSQTELKDLCKAFRKEGFMTAVWTIFTERSMLNKALVDELDYIMYGRCDQPCIISEKYYDPFTDSYDWTVLKNTNIHSA